MEDITTIHGDSGRAIRLGIADDGVPSEAPMLVGAESGFACFESALEGAPGDERHAFLQLANSMRASEDGMWLALAEGSQRRFGLVQSNRGVAHDRPGFYETQHGHSDGPVWRDFYYRAAYTLLDEIDRTWGPEAVLVHHLTGYGWLPGLAPVVLEAAGNLLDNRNLGIERIDLHPCGLKGREQVEDAIQKLAADEQHGHREIEVEERQPEDLGYEGPVPVRLLKVGVLPG